MRILIALQHFRMSGVVTWNHVLMRELLAQGHHVGVWFKEVQTEDVSVVKWFTQHTSDVSIVTPPNSHYDLAIANYTDLVDTCNRVSYMTKFVRHGTMFQLYDPHVVEGKIDAVLCLSGLSLKLTTRLPKNLVPNFIYPSDHTPCNRSEIKTALLCDIRTGTVYSKTLQKVLEDHNVNCHVIDEGHIIEVWKHFNKYDIVIGYGRVALEAMASGRHVLIYGMNGGDGFVNNANFDEIAYRNLSGFALKAIKPPYEDACFESFSQYISDNLHKQSPDQPSKNVKLVEPYTNKHIDTILQGAHAWVQQST